MLLLTGKPNLIGHQEENKNKAFKMTIKKTKIETKQTRKKGIEGWETNKKAKECHMSQQTKKKKKERP